MKSIFTLLLLSLVLNLAAQTPSVPDSSLYVQAVNNVLQSYKNEVQENLHIFNGTEYLRTGHGVKGTPFFQADSMFSGNVFYDGRFYENIPLHYNLVTDQVIINNYAKNNQIILVPEKLQYFNVIQHAFVRITADSALPSFIKTGYYDKLYDGKMMVLARRQKLPHIKGTALDNEIRYDEYTDYFVLLNNIFYRAGDKNAFLSIAGDKKEMIKKYIKDNKLKFKKTREADMVSVAGYYSQLKH